MARILIAAGGTAGHVVPALAVADALRDQGHDVLFVGGRRVERELVPAAGYPLRELNVEGVSRSNPLKALRAVGLAVVAVAKTWRMIGRIRPDVVVGAGGYVAGVAGFAAVLRRVPLVLTEADSHLGISNRLLARRARRVCLAFPIEGRDTPLYVVTGRPVPPPFTDRAAARAQFGIGSGEKCVLVFGGSLGARTINEAAVAAFADAPFRVLHASGERDFAALRPRVTREGYDLRSYISPFGPALAACDLVVARSGGSVFEVAAHARPAILIPYPYAAADHQRANAEYFQRAGAARVIGDAELDAANLRATVDALLANESALQAMSVAAARLARPEAARDIAAEVVSAA